MVCANLSSDRVKIKENVSDLIDTLAKLVTENSFFFIIILKLEIYENNKICIAIRLQYIS